MDLSDHTIDWGRCIYVDAEIDNELLVRLTPKILELRQQSNEPITVAINSVGGSINILETLKALLTGPNQDGDRCQIVTVVTHRAYSAAASLLAMGNYAVALSHADILFHDVRYGGLDDVTPTRALSAAKQLQTSNESASLKLANDMFARWMWNYLALREGFTDDAAKYPDEAATFERAVEACKIAPSPSFHFDLPGFASSLFARLTRANEKVLMNAMQHLERWATVMSLSGVLPKYADPTVKYPGMLDGARALFDQLMTAKPKHPFGGKEAEADLNLFLTLVVSRMSSSPAMRSTTNYERAVSDFNLVKAIDDPKHLATSTRLVLRHKHVFFGPETANAWDGLDPGARKEITDSAAPNVKATWLLCLLVARELFNGEHSLTAREALWLGLVDDVPGLASFESRRHVLKTAGLPAATSVSASQPPPRRLKRKRPTGFGG